MGMEEKIAARIQDVLAHAVGTPLSVTQKRTEAPLAFIPAADVKETASEFVVFVELPGIDEDGIEFVWEFNRLVVRGTRDFDHDGEDAEEYIQIERKYGAFEVSFEFKSPVDTDEATAKYRRGILKIRLPKMRRMT